MPTCLCILVSVVYTVVKNSKYCGYHNVRDMPSGKFNNMKPGSCCLQRVLQPTTYLYHSTLHDGAQSQIEGCALNYYLSLEKEPCQECSQICSKIALVFHLRLRATKQNRDT